MSKAKSKIAKGREEEETGDDVQQGGDELQQATQERREGSTGGKPGVSKQNKGEMVQVAKGNLSGTEEIKVAKIAEQVGKKMKLEINAKVKEMESLTYQREAAVKKAKRLSRKIEAVQCSADQESEFLAKHENDDELDRKKLSRIRSCYVLHCQNHLAKKEEIANNRAARQAVIRKHRDNLIEKAATQKALKEELEETNNNIKKLDIKMEDLPSDSGFSQDVSILLDDQIATRRKELECPVCLEEAAPPIYSCIAQHLVCAKCRLVHPEMHPPLRNIIYLKLDLGQRDL